MVFLRQLDRTNMAASRDYETSVIQKLNNLPMSWHTWVKEQADRYTEEKEYFDYEAPCGTPIGTKTDPCLKDPTKPVLRDDEGYIDWGDPNILSPKQSFEPYVDYTELDAVIMEASEFAGLTWNQDTETFKIATISLPLGKKPTPYIPQLEKEDSKCIFSSPLTEIFCDEKQRASTPNVCESCGWNPEKEEPEDDKEEETES